MPGGPDPLYVKARHALLDALDALRPHLDAITLVGAQAIYIHTGDADLAVPEYTTDADLAISSDDLGDEPLLADLLAGRGFTPREHPGAWLSSDGVYIDIMVAEALAGPGRRGARLGPHGSRSARRAKGLEAALADRGLHTIRALDPNDVRAETIFVAGPAALLIAKSHKIAERVGAQDRVRDKDALDVLRLLRAIEPDDLAQRFDQLLRSDVAAKVTREARSNVESLFANRDSEGVIMAVRAAGDDEDPDTISSSLVALVDELLLVWPPT